MYPRTLLKSLSVLPYAVLPPLFWAGNFVVGRLVRNDIAPFTLSFGRWGIALLVLLPFVWRTVRRDMPLYRQHIGRIAAVSFMGVFAFNALVYQGLHNTTTTNAVLLNSGIPALIMLLTAVWYRRRLPAWQVVGGMISLLGVVYSALHGRWEDLLTLSFNQGDILVCLSMVCWALYTLWMRDMPAAIDRKGLTAVQIFLALLILAPCCAWELSQAARLSEWNAHTLWALVYVGIFPSVFAYMLYNMAVQKIGAVRAGLTIHLMPVFGVLLSAVFLGEALYTYNVVGIAMIASGLLLSGAGGRSNRTQSA